MTEQMTNDESFEMAITAEEIAEELYCGMGKKLLARQSAGTDGTALSIAQDVYRALCSAMKTLLKHVCSWWPVLHLKALESRTCSGALHRGSSINKLRNPHRSSFFKGHGNHAYPIGLAR